MNIRSGGKRSRREADTRDAAEGGGMDSSEEPVQRMEGQREGSKEDSWKPLGKQQFHLHRPPPLKMEELFRFSDVEPICLPGQNSKDPYVHHAFSRSSSPSLSLFLSLSLCLF